MKKNIHATYVILGRCQCLYESACFTTYYINPIFNPSCLSLTVFVVVFRFSKDMYTYMAFVL